LSKQFDLDVREGMYAGGNHAQAVAYAHWKQRAKDVARVAPGWATARARWAAEADAREVIQRVASSDQPPTKDDKAAIQRYLETQVEGDT